LNPRVSLLRPGPYRRPKGVMVDRFGTRLRDARLALGLSQADVSKSLVTVTEFAMIESGRMHPDPVLAQALADRMQIPIDGTRRIIDPKLGNAVDLEAALRRGEWQRAVTLLEEFPQASAHHTYCAAVVLEQQGDFAGALAMLHEVLNGLETPTALRWRATVALCRCNRYAGALQESIAGAEAALLLLESRPDVDAETIAELRATLAGTYCETGELMHALDLTEQRDGAQLETPWSQATQRWARSMVLQRIGQAAESAALAFEALHILASLDQPRTVARMQNNTAWLAMQSPDFDAGVVEQLLRDAENAFRKDSAGVDLAFVLTSRAEFSVHQKEADLARDCLREALEITEREDLGLRARITAAAAQIYASLGDTDTSMQHLLTARTLLEDSGAKRSAAAAWKLMAETYAALGHTDLQLACLRAAMELLEL